MASEGSPPLDLDLVQGRKATTEKVATIPFKPASFVGILLGIGEDRILFGFVASWAGDPALCLPFGEWETGLDLERIEGRIGLLGREFPFFEGAEEPLFRVFQETIVQVLPFKDAEFQHLFRREGGFKSRSEAVTWCVFQAIGVALLHAIMDTDQRPWLVVTLGIPFLLQESDHVLGGGQVEGSLVFEVHAGFYAGLRT